MWACRGCQLGRGNSPLIIQPAGRESVIAHRRRVTGVDPHADHTGNVASSPARELAARLASLLLGAIVVVLGLFGGFGSYYAVTDVGQVGSRVVNFLFIGLLPLILAAELWARARPPLTRLIAGGSIPVRLAGDLSWPLCYRYVHRKRSGGGVYGGGGDGGGGDAGGGGGN